MRSRHPILPIVTFLFFAILLAACGKRSEKPTLSPAEANTKVFDSVMVLVGKGKVTTETEFISARNNLSAAFIEKVRSDSLAGESRLQYGQLLLWSGSARKARGIFEDMRRDTSEYAHEAWKELITMDIEAEKYSKAERLMEEYRAAFPPRKDDLERLFSQSTTLCDRYSEAGDLEAAIRVCTDELNSLPADAPFQSYSLGMNVLPHFMETGRLEEGRTLVETYKSRLATTLALREKNASVTPPDSSEAATTDAIKAYVNYFSTLSAQLDLLGKKAPAFQFMRVYNGDSTLSIEALKGKVVMIDFWTTWCLPCVIGYVEARRIYADYRERGLEILGITSLQGKYRDRDTGAREGTKDQPLSKAREIELTGEYVKKHEMTWPCGVSTRSVIDSEYGVFAIPTFVLVDREGIIRFIQTGIGQEKQKRRMIEKMLGT